MHLTISVFAVLVASTLGIPQDVGFLEARAVKTRTKTIPAPSGFIPLRTSLPGTSCDSNCGPNPIASLPEARGASPALAARATTTTVYAACATPNIGDLYNSKAFKYIMGITGGTDHNSFANTTDAYGCCVFAFTQDFPVALWQWAEGTCVTYNVDAGPQADNTYRVFLGAKQYQSVFGNGPAGEIIKAGKGKVTG